MTPLQILMLLASAFFAYKIYQHIQTLQDPQGEETTEPTSNDSELERLMQEGDEALEKKDLDKALAIYREINYKLQKENIRDAEILFKIGYTLMEQERFEEALEYYEEALEVEPHSSAFHQAIASALKALKRFEEAQQHLQSALDIDPQNPITYYNYGNLLQEMGKTEEAKTMYQEALKFDAAFKEAKEELEKLT